MYLKTLSELVDEVEYLTHRVDVLIYQVAGLRSEIDDIRSQIGGRVSRSRNPVCGRRSRSWHGASRSRSRSAISRVQPVSIRWRFQYCRQTGRFGPTLTIISEDNHEDMPEEIIRFHGNLENDEMNKSEVSSCQERDDYERPTSYEGLYIHQSILYEDLDFYQPQVRDLTHEVIVLSFQASTEHLPDLRTIVAGLRHLGISNTTEPSSPSSRNVELHDIVNHLLRQVTNLESLVTDLKTQLRAGEALELPNEFSEPTSGSGEPIVPVSRSSLGSDPVNETAEGDLTQQQHGDVGPSRSTPGSGTPPLPVSGSASGSGPVAGTPRCDQGETVADLLEDLGSQLVAFYSPFRLLDSVLTYGLPSDRSYQIPAVTTQAGADGENVTDIVQAIRSRLDALDAQRTPDLPGDHGETVFDLVNSMRSEASSFRDRVRESTVLERFQRLMMIQEDFISSSGSRTTSEGLRRRRRVETTSSLGPHGATDTALAGDLVPGIERLMSETNSFSSEVARLSAELHGHGRQVERRDRDAPERVRLIQESPRDRALNKSAKAPKTKKE
ncbi:hypothetical protein LguiB_026342 [Lonicera macranthoides]